MKVYHYCVMESLEVGQSYSSGSIAFETTVSSNEHYSELISDLKRHLGKDKGDFVLISLNLLN